MHSKEDGESLTSLPPEILIHITVHIETLKVLSKLSQTCKKLYDFIKHDGFRVFVQTRFQNFQPPALPSSSFWRDAALGLATLERNWGRKALLAREISLPATTYQNRDRQRQYMPRGQTIGYVPVIDSYQSWCGGDWRSRKEVIAWGAGAELIVHVKGVCTGTRKQAPNHSEALKDKSSSQQRPHLIRYHEAGAVEGRDDITSLILLSQQNLEESERVIVGRANGDLSLTSLSADASQNQAEILSFYQTAGRGVRSAAINPSSQRVLAACLTDSSVSIFPLAASDRHVAPAGEVSAIPSQVPGRIWTCQFLNTNQLAVGLGPSKEPMRVYDIGREQISNDNALSLAIVDEDINTRVDTLDEDHSSVSDYATSIYSLTSIPEASVAGGFNGNLFLSGAYDGLTRYDLNSSLYVLVCVAHSSSLHDIRTPSSVNSVFRDPVDTYAPIYSLLPFGTQRFIAGGGRHSIIKIFDLRIPGSRLFDAADIGPGRNVPGSSFKQGIPRRTNDRCHNVIAHKSHGWNVFLNLMSHQGRPHQRRRESPVYTLSRPSQHSPSFFAGIEGRILRLDLMSIMDKHSDPWLENQPSDITGPDDVYHREKTAGEAVRLSMYVHTTGPVNLLKQRSWVSGSGLPARPGLDERWYIAHPNERES
ncbi:hypothetical protein ACLMJK_005523 [Lecanora helva]